MTVYQSFNSSWTEEDIINAINERSQYYRASAYYSEIIDYWENVREVRDISNVELYNYFMGCIWYNPTSNSTDTERM